MVAIELRGLTVTRDGLALLDDIDLSVAAGERIAVLGPSGSGKTTLLRGIAGVEEVSAGRVFFGDVDVTHTHPRDRNVAMIDQGASLQPHLDVQRNLGFALRLRRTPKPEIEERVAAEARTFSLRGLLRRRPGTLSGGERHEVALARTLVRRPSALLMDEPFRRIDPVRRGLLLRELIRVQAGYDVPLLLATNDQRTAQGIAQRILVLEGGRAVQVGTPAEVHDTPATIFAASFIGTPPMNLIDGRVTRVDGQIHVQAGPLSIPTWAVSLTNWVGAPVVLGIRPHDLALDLQPSGPGSRLRVVRCEFLGADIALHLAGEAGSNLLAVTPRPGPRAGARVGISLRPADIHLFDLVSGRAIAHGL